MQSRLSAGGAPALVRFLVAAVACALLGAASRGPAVGQGAPSPTPTPTPLPSTSTPSRTPTVPILNAAFVSQSVPTTMTAGQQVAVSVTMQNTGNTTWTAAMLHRLGAINPYDNSTWGLGRVALGAGDSIAPGQQKTFSFNVTAPSVAGTHNFQWRMLREGVTWFGAETPNVAVVVAAARNAAFVAQTVPTSMNPGQQYNVSVTMRNTGSTTWTAAALYRLGATNPQNNMTWGTGRVVLAAGDSIAPQQQKTFSFSVTAPINPGTYNFQWQMLQEGVAWFGAPSTNAVVNVAGAGTLNAAFVRQNVPAPMIAGERYAVSMTVRNTGTATWTAGTAIRLGAINPYDNTIWGIGRVSLLPGESIAPSQEKTFTWTVTAPSPTGTYNFQWRMLQEGVTWFGAESPAIPLNTGVFGSGGSSLRFFGTGSGDIDRVKIPLDAPARPIDVGGDFTLEWWMKTSSGNSTTSTCQIGVGDGDNWITGNIIFDRDVNGAGDLGDYGVSLFGNGLSFGVDRMGSGATICSTDVVDDGQWHHVAATRNATSGQLRLFVDGQPNGAAGSGPTGDVSYDDGRSPAAPDDPFLVIGAEKHDAGSAFPSYHGWVDEVRVSNVVRYTGAFTRPSAPFVSDANTVALYHFDEDNGITITDSSGASGGPSAGEREVGGPSAGPQWSTDVPFAAAAPTITLQTLTTALSAPTSITHAGDGRLFITEQGGTIRIWDGTQLLATPFLTISPINSGGEEGLLSVAFHPQYTQNGFFYVYYNNASGNVAIARYRVSANPNVADPSSGVTLLTIPHPAGNHNGGQLQFGPDGYLYTGIGDGGGGCDTAGSGCNAQRDNLLLGKMLRLDVDQNVNSVPYYGIPPSNPYVGAGDPRDEIWSEGLRNPWRFVFDRLTGGLFIGDVGQNTQEEVDYRPAESTGGENFGWNWMEGFDCNTCAANCPMPTPAPNPCNHPSLTLPILDYDHSLGCSITGGYVYRGLQVPRLYGKYLYGDLCSGRIWWAVQNGLGWTTTQFSTTASSLYSFGQDVNGEIYVARGNGTLAKIRP